jgi:hypothetical protein
MNDEMKKKRKKNKKKNDELKSRSTDHCTCSIERVIELEANKLD